jgi:hypothetical protein
MNKKRMDYRRIFFLLVIGLFLFSFLSGVVSADTPATETTQKVKGVFITLWDSFFGGLFDGASSWELDIGVAQLTVAGILLFLLVTLLVYSVADFLPFFPENQPWIKTAFAFIVGALAFLFIEEETIKSITGTYGALGVTLASIIPLLILIAFSFKLYENKNFKPYAKFLTIFIFLIFGLWMIYSWQERLQKGEQYATIYLVSAGIAGLWMILGERIISKWIKSKTIAAHKAGFEQGTKDTVERLKVNLRDLEDSYLHYSIPAKGDKQKPLREKAALLSRINDLRKNLGLEPFDPLRN